MANVNLDQPDNANATFRFGGSLVSHIMQIVRENRQVQ